jgi:hypothetical protein
MDIEKLVFIDETWASTNMTRRYGRAPKGQRRIATAPLGNWQTTTFVAGFRHHRLTAPMVLDGPMDGEIFFAWLWRGFGKPLRRRAQRCSICHPIHPI